MTTTYLVTDLGTDLKFWQGVGQRSDELVDGVTEIKEHVVSHH